MTLSTGIPTSAVGRVTGWAQGFKDFRAGAANLPQRIALLSPIATGKVSGFTAYDIPNTVNSIKDVYDTYGICPAFFVTRILKPSAGGGVGSVPVDVFPIEDAAGAVASAGDITPSGTATANATHTVVFNGRESIEGRRCDFSVETGDAVADIVTKITAAINGFIYAPVGATDSTTTCDVVAVWKGTLGDEISISIETNNIAAGITYAFTQPTGGVGAHTTTDALANFGDVWYTQVIDVAGTENFAANETVNGAPDPDTGGTGRWGASVVKPFVAFSGSTESTIATVKALMASRKLDLTNALCVAPNSPGYSFEAAANVVALTAPTFDSSPHRTVNGKAYPDMPAPTNDDIGDMKTYLTRDDLVKNGCSTVSYTASSGYVIEDLITFRRPDTQVPTAIDWRYVRDIIGIDFNVIYNYRLKEETYLKDKTIAADGDVIGVSGVIKPKEWKSIVYKFIDEMSKAAIMSDAAFAKASVQVAIGTSNPQRFETLFYYKRTGIARVLSTTAYAGFNFGS